MKPLIIVEHTRTELGRGNMVFTHTIEVTLKDRTIGEMRLARLIKKALPIIIHYASTFLLMLKEINKIF